MNRRPIVCVTLLVLTLAARPVYAQSSDAAIFPALPKTAEDPRNPLTPEKVELGKKLFFEKRFSKSGTISCNSCHNLATYGVDNLATSPGHEGKHGDRNSPSVLNAALHIAQFWDGRAKSVEEQALGPILNPVEMGMPDAAAVLAILNGSEEYKQLFKKAFPNDKDPVTFGNLGEAIGAYERTLLTPCRFDTYLTGDKAALSRQEQKGFETFKSVGCTVCHIGQTIGGGMFQKIGLVKPYPTQDPGRFKVTNQEMDRFFFKVPSLRNVEKTDPYLHDGSVKTLPEVVSIMAEYQLGRKLTDEQLSDIVAFLKSLTAPLPSNNLQ